MESATMLDGGSDGDAAVLADVLAFLDGFGDVAVGLADVEAMAVAGVVDSPPLPVNKHRAKPSRTAWAPSAAKAENRARVTRYRQRKNELQALRNMVEYLNNQLEFAMNSRDARSARWKKRAELELERRRRADEANTQLRRLMRAQMQWSRLLGVMSKKFWWSTWEYYLSCPFTGSTSSGQSGPDGLAATLSATRAADTSSSSAWSTTFLIPEGHPERVGNAWWTNAQRQSLFKGCEIESFSLQSSSALRVEKRMTWSVLDDANEEITFNGAVLFEVIKSDAVWTLVVTADVFDATGNTLLFRTAAVRAVSQSQSSSLPSCEFQAHYWITLPGESTTPAPLRPTHLESIMPRMQAHAAEVGAKTWASVMRQKDQRMQLVFGAP